MMAAMKRSALAAMRRPAKRSGPTSQELFTWAVSRTDPTVAEAARHFKCRHGDIVDAIDCADVEGGYLGIVAALKYGSGVYALEHGHRIVEAYYTPDIK